MRSVQFLTTWIMLVIWSSAMAIDQPNFTVVHTYEAFELRRYEPYW